MFFFIEFLWSDEFSVENRRRGVSGSEYWLLCDESRKVLSKVLKSFIVHRCSPSVGSVRQCSMRGKGFHLLSFCP